MSAILALEGVTKRFGGVTAVDDLTFAAPQGKILGFLGRNGAGKTTTLRMALDILRPDAGAITVLGRRPGKETRQDVGFLPEERGLYRRMKAIDTLVYFARLKGLSPADARQRAVELLERMELSEASGRMVEKLSKGMAQKLQLACAIAGRPKLLLLDEPFSGLDPVSQALLEEVILEAARSGSTVVFSTHVMQHAERLCDSLLVIAKGRKVFEGTQTAARRLLPSRLTLSAREDPRRIPLVKDATEGAADADGWREWQVTLKAKASAEALLEACFDCGLKLRRFEEHRPSLHDVFLRLAGDETEAEAA